MGLDNGIYIKLHAETDIRGLVPVDDFGEIVEICYWRKCWGIRNDILSILNIPANTNDNNVEIHKEDIPRIITLLKWYIQNDENWWYSQSPWERRDLIKPTKQFIKNLKWTYNRMDKRSFKVYFYDSY